MKPENLDKIIRLKEYSPEAEKDMLVIQANTNRLLALTNQLLDMKKLENGDEKLDGKDVILLKRKVGSN